jgi:hypothetical protein
MIQFRCYLLNEKKIRLAKITIFSFRSRDELTLDFLLQFHFIIISFIEKKERFWDVRVGDVAVVWVFNTRWTGGLVEWSDDKKRFRCLLIGYLYFVVC